MFSILGVVHKCFLSKTSQTFYEQLFLYESVLCSFPQLTVWLFAIFFHNNICTKAARNFFEIDDTSTPPTTATATATVTRRTTITPMTSSITAKRAKTTTGSRRTTALATQMSTTTTTTTARSLRINSCCGFRWP